MKVHYPKLYNMAHFLALNFLLLPKDLTIIFILQNQKAFDFETWHEASGNRALQSLYKS